MEARKRTSKQSTIKTERRRGRPAGKNRVPLSLEERRARNAQYERERRNETAGAMAQLADAAGCDHTIANADLLATVISQLQRRVNRTPPKHSLGDLQRINDNLETQIALLEKRLADDPDYNAEELDKSNSDSTSSSGSDSDSSEPKRPTKCRKITKRSTVHRTETTKQRIKYESTSSTHSQDSAWSGNHFDVSAPPQEATDSPQPHSNRSSVLYSPESISPETQHYRPEANLAFQFVPDQEFVPPGRSQHRSETAFNGPFNGTESNSLDFLKTDDFLYSETDPNELNLDWPLADYNEFLTTC